MADIGRAQGGLDELHASLKGNISGGGFNNSKVIWMVKAWSKIGTLIRGSYHKQFAMHLFRQISPPALTGSQKRSQLLLRELGTLSDALSSHGKLPNDDIWKRAHQAMVDFVQDYWGKTIGNKDPRTSEKDFATQLRSWFGKSEAEVLKEQIFQQDRHA
jgi:hypothetical protein